MHHRGVYGLRLSGLVGVDHLLRPARASWPEVTVMHSVGPQTLTSNDVGDDEASFRLSSGAADVRLDRRAMTAHFTTDEALAEEAFVHPHLGLAVGVFSRWLGRDVFHAGVVDVGGRAFGVMGAREAGKSSLMAMLHLQGHTVLADDVCVVDGASALPGPALIDLRESAAKHLGRGDDIGVVGLRRRWRLVLPTAAEPTPLAGWVVPSWGSDEGARPLPLSARVAHLFSNLGITRAPVHPERLLDLARLPMLEWRRPREWTLAEASTARLADHLRGL